jgi:hypothetical protein
MFLNRFSNIERTDVIKFTIYLVIFFVLFFGYNNAISPIKNIEYNSAPEYINNKEVTVFDI